MYFKELGILSFSIPKFPNESNTSSPSGNSTDFKFGAPQKLQIHFNVVGNFMAQS